MKIKHIIFFMFILFSIIPLTLLGIADMQYYNKKLKELLENDLYSAIVSQRQAIETYFDERLVDVRTITNFGFVQRLLILAENNEFSSDQSEIEYTNEILAGRAKDNPFADSIAILDRDFKVIACSRKYTPGEVSALAQIDPKYLGPDMHFTQVYDSTVTSTGDKAMIAIMGIYDNNNLLGYIIEELNLSFFENLRLSSVLFNDVVIYILDDKNNMITAGTSTSSLKHFTSSEKDRSNFYEAWDNRDKNSVEGVISYEMLGATYLTSYSGFTNLDWQLLVSINLDAAMSNQQNYRRLLFFITILLIALFCCVEVILSGKLAKPIENMVTTFQKIRRTQDFSIRMKAIKNNELGTVSTEINELLYMVEENTKKEQKTKELLQQRAEKDSLTDLLNKKAIEAVLSEEFYKASGTQSKLGYLFIDVDDFKDFNTKYGHSGGDKVLCFIAQMIKEFRLGLAGRVGGDEFTVCITDPVTIVQLDSLLADFLDRLNKGVILEDNIPPVMITCSIGGAISDSSQKSYQDFIEQADEAMYYVKDKGKNSYFVKNL